MKVFLYRHNPLNIHWISTNGSNKYQSGSEVEQPAQLPLYVVGSEAPPIILAENGWDL